LDVQSVTRRYWLQGLAIYDAVAVVAGIIYFLVGSWHPWWNFIGIGVLLALLATIGSLAMREVPQWFVTIFALTFLIAGLIFIVQGASAQGREIRPILQTSVVLLALTSSTWVLWRAKNLHARPMHVRRFVVLIPGYGAVLLVALDAYIKMGLPFPKQPLLWFLNGILTPSPILVGTAAFAVAVWVSRWARSQVTALMAVGLGVVTLAVQLYPVGATLVGKAQVNNALASAGVDKIPWDIAFRGTPYLLTENLLPTAIPAAQVTKDVVYYRGENAAEHPEDADVVLKADVYRPSVDNPDFPGHGSVLIRIHGGGYAAGDKGRQNTPGQNDYFANQGYTVFDIQYGLRDASGTSVDPRMGDFGLDDMVRHVGIFTTWLADHAIEYDTKTSSVFLSGGSAGGHIVLAVGLAAVDSRYADLFDERVIVRGVLPLYPSAGLAVIVDIPGARELDDVRGLLSSSAPPTLGFSGTRDSITPHWLVRDILAAYPEAGAKSGLVVWPWGEHGSDVVDEGPYAQMFFYAAERFMAYYAAP